MTDKLTVLDRRFAVVDEAMSWLKTPFHPHGHVKGAGCDCLTIVTDPFKSCGIVVQIDVPDYSGHWHLNQGAPEYYLDGMMKYCDEIQLDEVMPADIAVFHFGRAYSHAALVADYPHVIHSINPIGVTLTDMRNDAQLIREAKRYPPKFYSPWRRL